MEHDAAEDLHREVGRAEHAVGGLTADGERVRQDIVERLTLLETLFERGRLGLEFLVRHFFVFFLQCEHLVAKRLDPLEFTLAVISKQLCEYMSHSFHLIKIKYPTSLPPRHSTCGNGISAAGGSDPRFTFGLSPARTAHRRCVQT